jgi:hypothetical protein
MRSKPVSKYAVALLCQWQRIYNTQKRLRNHLVLTAVVKTEHLAFFNQEVWQKESPFLGLLINTKMDVK